MPEPGDPVFTQLRDQISDNDVEIVELLNRRLRLVEQLWRHKAEHGVQIDDPDREERMLSLLTHANKGPLSPEALARLYREIVAVSKEEARRLGADGRGAGARG